MDFFATLGTATTSMATAVMNAFTTLTGIFWTPGAEGSLGSPTFVGILVLGGLGLSIVTFAISKLLSLAKIRK